MTKEASTYKIDPETGLPELPEGHFWRVTEGSLSIMKEAEPPGEWENVTKDEYDRVVAMSWRGPTHEWRIAEKISRSRFGGIIHDPQHQVRKTPGPTKVFRKSYADYEGMGYFEVEIARDPVSEDNILKRAIETLRAWEAQLKFEAERAKRQKLYGDYPPKKFEKED